DSKEPEDLRVERGSPTPDHQRHDGGDVLSGISRQSFVVYLEHQSTAPRSGHTCAGQRPASVSKLRYDQPLQNERRFPLQLSAVEIATALQPRSVVPAGLYVLAYD